MKHKDKNDENDDLWRAVGELEGMKTMLSERITANEDAIDDLTTSVATNEMRIEDLETGV